MRAAAKARMADAKAGYAAVAKRKVAGWLDEVAPEKLREVVELPLLHPELHHPSIGPPKGVLLYGPPFAQRVLRGGTLACARARGRT